MNLECRIEYMRDGRGDGRADGAMRLLYEKTREIENRNAIENSRCENRGATTDIVHTLHFGFRAGGTRYSYRE